MSPDPSFDFYYVRCAKINFSKRLAEKVPLISVLMPVRDGRDFVAEAVQSIFLQTCADFELLIVDDGSQDDTLDILADLAGNDQRLRVFRQDRRGLVPALNLGLSAARAPFVARMDADDVAHPTRLALQAEALNMASDVAVVGSACRIIGPDGSTRRTVRPPTGADAVHAELLRRNCIVHPTVMMRRQAVMACGGYRSAFLLAEDFDLWLRLRERHKLINLDVVLLHYREHPGQTTWRYLEQRILSEMGALAGADCRMTGRDDCGNGAAPVDHAQLLAMGWTSHTIRNGLLGRALGAAKDALAAGNREAAREAVELAMRQNPAPRTRVHLNLLMLRSRF